MLTIHIKFKQTFGAFIIRTQYQIEIDVHNLIGILMDKHILDILGTRTIHTSVRCMWDIICEYNYYEEQLPDLEVILITVYTVHTSSISSLILL